MEEEHWTFLVDVTRKVDEHVVCHVYNKTGFQTLFVFFISLQALVLSVNRSVSQICDILSVRCG